MTQAKSRPLLPQLILFGGVLITIQLFGSYLGFPHILSQLFGWIPLELKEAATWAYSHL